MVGLPSRLEKVTEKVLGPAAAVKFVLCHAPVDLKKSLLRKVTSKCYTERVIVH